MTKPEMAEWLVDYLVGWENVIIYGDSGNNAKLHYGKDARCLQKFFYSPDGFFAVMKALKDEPILEDARFIQTWTDFLFNMEDSSAVYQAIYEAMK